MWLGGIGRLGRLEGGGSVLLLGIIEVLKVVNEAAKKCFVKRNS